MAGIVFGCIAPHPPIVIPGIGSDKDRDIVWQTISGIEDLAETLRMSNPETVIIVSPHNYYTASINMTISFTNTAEGNLHKWGTRLPGYQFENDLKLAELIMEEAQKANISVQSVHPNNYKLDHGILVPLHFLADSFKGASLLPITFSGLPLNTHFYFGKAIQKAKDISGQSQPSISFA